MLSSAGEPLPSLSTPARVTSLTAAVDGALGGFAIPARIVASFATVALEGVLVTSARSLPVSGQYGVRALHFLYALAEMTGAGVIAAALVVAWLRGRDRLRTREVPPIVPIAAAALVIAAFTLPEDVSGVASRLPLIAPRVSGPLLVGLVAFAVAVAVVAAFPARRRFGTVAPVAGGLALGALHAFGSPDYPGMHLMAALTGASWLAIGIGGPAAGPASVRPSRGRRRLLFGAGAVAVGLLFVVFLARPVPNAILADMLRSPSTVLAPFARSAGLGRIPKAHVAPRLRQWFTSRAKLAPVPARSPRALPADAVVVLITVDALRADVILSGKHDAELPAFAALRNESVRFTNARTPAPQTVVALTSLFSGKYYSSLFFSEGKEKHPLAAKDKSVRFSDILTKSGVKTVTFPTLADLVPEHGTIGSFGEVAERKVLRHETSPLAADMATLIVTRLEKAAAEPAPTFLYAHLTDPHEPYDRGGTDCEPFACYLREVALVDAAIARVRKVMADKLGGRAVLIVAADHGEAFGEHGTRYHASTVFDELLRIPLLVNGPGFTPRAVDAPVTLLDVGPTILDLFGEATPPSFMGESLLGVLSGKSPAFTRPIAADTGRLMQAMLFDDNVKIVRDKRKKIVQLFDLNADPGELRSIFESAPDARERVAQLDAFFRANAYRKKGYKPPYRK